MNLRLYQFRISLLLFLVPAAFLQTARSQSLSSTLLLSDWGIDSLASIRLGQLSSVHANSGGQLKVYSLYDGPYLDRLLLADSTPPSSDSNCHVIAEFAGEAVNALGGGWSPFQKSPSASTVDYTQSPDDRIVLRMSYNRASSGYCGMWMRLWRTRLFSDSHGFFDARPYGFLTFWIRGTAGGEHVLLKVADEEWERKEDSVPVGSVSNFVSTGRIETGWQLAVVPLSDLPTRINPAKLATLVFEASHEGTGSVELSTLAFCKEPTFLPDLSAPLPRPSRKRILKKSIWAWNTSEILGSKGEEDRFLTFLKNEEFKQIFLALPYDPKHSKSITIEAKKLRPVMKRLKASGIAVHALSGDKDFTLPANHDFVVNSIREVIRYNKSSSADERFKGIHLDVEPYLLAGFGSSRRDSILGNFIRLLSKTAETARAGGLRIGVDLPAWFDDPDELTGEDRIIDIKGTTKALLDHILDIVDDVTLMDYRTDAGGGNGIAAQARGELKMASIRGKDVYVGLETEALPDETIVIFKGEPLPGWPVSNRPETYIAFAGGGDSVIAALVPSSDLPDYRKFLERMQIDPAHARFWPAVRQYRVEGTTLSFASLGSVRLSTAIRQSEVELSTYPAFSGFAIHHYRSYRKLLQR